MSKHDIYRRDAVSFDSRYFEKQKKLGKNYTLEKTFNHINAINLWGSSESSSGEGSTAIDTASLKPNLQKLLHDLQIKTIVDAGCGDFGWVGALDLTDIHYYGFDVLEETISNLQKTFKSNKQLQFKIADISQAALPRADLILCRDCFVHYSFDDINKVLSNFKKSGSKYLLTTTFTETGLNENIVTGDWRTLNLQLTPFNFPQPLSVITEKCMQNDGLYKDKSLALWEIQSIPGGR